MNKKYYLIVHLFFLAVTQQLLPVSLVYSMKIRRIFAPSIPMARRSHILLSAAPIINYRTRVLSSDILGASICNTEKSLSRGSLLDIRYMQKTGWFEVTTGVGKESICTTGTNNFRASRTGLDDIVCAGGYTLLLSERSQFDMYGLAGFPSKRALQSFEVFDTLMGTRFFSVGGGAEVSYSLLQTSERTLFFSLQGRIIHFFDRTWSPILPDTARIKPGEIIGILCAGNYTKNKLSIEVGYNPSISINQAILLDKQTVRGSTFIQHSCYIDTDYSFKKTPSTGQTTLIGAGLSLGITPKYRARMVTGWLHATIIF